MSQASVLMWFRRDLRACDNAALNAALRSGASVYCVFVFDRRILASLPPDDKRLAFIHAALTELQQTLRDAGGELLWRDGDPVHEIPALARELGCSSVYANRDYEPYARQRDTEVAARLAANLGESRLYKDMVIFEQDQLLTGQSKPYTVYTPYMKRWRQNFHPALAAEASTALRGALATPAVLRPLPTLAELGFAEATLDGLRVQTGRSGALALLDDFRHRIAHYKTLRDFPAVKGVSYLSAHLRFGTLSVREAVRAALAEPSEGAACWLNELIWREFYQQLLWHFPAMAGNSFKPEYRNLPFPNDKALFEAWCQGRTGYPLVDAAMRQLNHSGYMHNRLRMIAASFLVKDLLVDWRWGEAYFAQKLLDFDLAANNGGWQWAASTGCDAQPYFRIFNPVTQSEKFDAKGQFIRRYVPELAALDDKAIHAPWLAKSLPPGFALGRDYPAPVVDHATQREAALKLFARD